KGLLALLAKELPKDAQGNVLSSGITTTNTTEANRKALWNYWIVANDGSYGIHNTSFAVQVLQTTIKELTGKAVGAEAKAMPKIPAGHATSNCNVCHEPGLAGAPKWPADHAGRTPETCTTCHQKA
ncbi:MAG: hypothetical protein AB1603_03695, partial [Chloroflexota bacterium]